MSKKISKTNLKKNVNQKGGDLICPHHLGEGGTHFALKAVMDDVCNTKPNPSEEQIDTVLNLLKSNALYKDTDVIAVPTELCKDLPTDGDFTIKMLKIWLNTKRANLLQPARAQSGDSDESLPTTSLPNNVELTRSKSGKPVTIYRTASGKEDHIVKADRTNSGTEIDIIMDRDAS